MAVYEIEPPGSRPGASPPAHPPPHPSYSADPPRGSAVFDGKSCRDAFTILLEHDLWPVAITPKGTERPGRDPSQGKDPIGLKWGVVRWTPGRADAAFRKFPGAGVGLCLGPGKGPGGEWLADVEGDGPGAEESRAKLLGGEQIETMGWESTRGFHNLLTLDPERIAAILPRLKALESKDANGAGVYKSPELPGLELRIGGYKPDGTVKQLQSVCPPTPGTDGRPRTWSGPRRIAPAPGAFYRFLEAQAPPAPTPRARRPITPDAGPRLATPDRESRRIANYGSTALDEEAERVASTPEGNRHNALRDASMNVAGLVKAGALSVHDYRAGLHAAAGRCGLPEAEASALIEGALEKATPRDLTRARAWVPDNGAAEGNGHVASAEVTPDAPSPALPGVEASESSMPTFGNYHREEYVDGEGRHKTRIVPHDVHAIDADLTSIAPGWPKRVGDRLFVATRSEDPEPVFLDSSNRLFAHIDGRAGVDWAKGPRLITQERYYQHMTMTVERFDSIELMPHTPASPGVFYLHRPLPAPTDKLRQFVDFFCPETRADRVLIEALILTLSWGGPSGKRPAFLITGPVHDPEPHRQGRGVGKSTLLDAIADHLYLGSVEAGPNEDLDAFKTRLLSRDALNKRMVRHDNIKTWRLSNAELEAMITSRTISGRALYQGEGRRPNTLVHVITLNGASLSSDLAERVVMIRLARPAAYVVKWSERVGEFATRHRWEILAEAAELLSRPSVPFARASRWSEWEAGVLSKLDHAEECQAVILRRQAEVNDDSSNREIFRDSLCAKIREHGHDPETAVVKIRSDALQAWLNEALGESIPINKAATFIKALMIPELNFDEERKFGVRGFIWVGIHSTHTDLTLLDTASGPPSRIAYSGRDRAAR